MIKRALLTILCATSTALAAENIGKQPELPAMQETSPGVFELGKMRIDKNTSTVSFPARINMAQGFLEYLLVTPKGSTHEALLVSEVQPTDLHLAMLLLGAKGAGLTTPAPGDAPGGPIDAEYLKRAPKMKGDSVILRAKWTKDGKEVVTPVEDWILNSDTKKPGERGPWIYTGSMFSNEHFMAQLEGLFASIVISPSALINNPRKGSDNDQIWTVNEKAVPPVETPLELSIRLEPTTTATK